MHLICNCYKLLPIVGLQISSKKFPKLKEVDDVLGGKEAWENVDSTEGNIMNKINNLQYLERTQHQP